MWQVASEFVSVKAVSFSLNTAQAELASRPMSYVGEAVSVRRPIISSKVIGVWPVIGEAAVCPIVDHIDPQLAAELANPRGCLRPVEGWPKQTPRSKVFVEDHEWFGTVRAAYLRGMMTPVADEQIVVNQLGAKVLHGAMAVDKGVDDQQFICIF